MINESLEDLLTKYEKKTTLSLKEYVIMRESLEKINISIAEQIRDDIWTIHGEWQGIGLGNISAKDIIQRVRELLNIYG